MADYRQNFLPTFRRDFYEIIDWSEEHFGSVASDRYAALIDQAILDVFRDPQRPGTKFRPDLAENAYVYHLVHSRGRVAGEAVRKPRHFLLYRLVDNTIEYARLLHDSRDLRRHVPAHLQPAS